MRAVRTLVVRLFYLAAVLSGGYYLWNRAYRAAAERRWRDQRLPEFRNPAELVEALGTMAWVSDPLGGLFDVVSLPGRVEARRQETLRDRERYPADARVQVGDCDDFAVYAAAAIAGMCDRGGTDWVRPMLATVAWHDATGVFRAHAVCVFWEPGRGRWGHVGNWARGKPFYGPDGEGRPAVEGLRELFLRKVVGPGGELVAWSAGSWELRGRPLLGEAFPALTAGRA